MNGTEPYPGMTIAVVQQQVKAGYDKMLATMRSIMLDRPRKALDGRPHPRRHRAVRSQEVALTPCHPNSLSLLLNYHKPLVSIEYNNPHI
jgi:hypothetical protein